MFVKRNRSKRGDKTYESVLLVHGERVPEKRPRGRPRKDAPPPKTKVRHRTLANLSHLPEELVELIEGHCKGVRFVPETGSDPELCVGPAYGALAALKAIAKEAGLLKVLGDSRRGRLALFLIMARVIHQGSRLSSVRWAEDQAVNAVLGLSRFDEDDLYETLDWLEERHEEIEVALAREYLGERTEELTIFLYDVTSSYFEGQLNELAAPGYNRDGKRFKKQVVIGLLTDADGEPVAIRVFRGNTSDPKTVSEPIRVLAEQLGVKNVVFVGDRGMVKSKPRELLTERGFYYITALTDPQVRKLLKDQSIQMSLFDEEPTEVVTEDGRRLVLRRNPDTLRRARQRRASQEAKVRSKVEARNKKVRASPRCKPESSLRQAEAALKAYKLDRFVGARLEGREVRLVVDEAKKAEVELLDGCYVLETDTAPAAVPTETVHDRYMDLTGVERDFRSLKTVDLEIRPIFLRKANRTRAHALVAMLALKVLRRLQRRVFVLGITAQDALDRLDGLRLVTLVDPRLGLWRLPTRFTETQQEVLDCLPRLPAPVLSRQPSGPRGVGRTRTRTPLGA